MSKERIANIQISLRKCDVSERVVSPNGKRKLPNGQVVVTSGKVYVSPDWIGRTVLVVLKDDK